MSSLPRTWPNIVLHADMDAFYAAVEQLDDPALRSKPVLVGPRNARGVVLTASYEARPFHVGSAMPMAQALKRCPHAIVVPPRFERYTELSATIMAVFREFSPDVEALSLDEAFLDMTGAEHIFGGPEAMAQQVRAAVKEATGGLNVSVGAAHVKYVAKVASGLAKPNGLQLVPPDQAVSWLAPLPVSRLWGAGPKTQARLAKAGYQTIGDIARADPRRLRDQLGSMGSHFFELAHARDPRRVEHSRRSRSMGSDRTLNKDISSKADIARHLRRSAERIARRLRRKSTLAGGVRVRLKTSSFQLLSRQCSLADPTDVAEILYSSALQLLDRFDHPGPFRLVGMAAHSLIAPGTVADPEPRQLDLLGDDTQRRLETTIDSLAERFGDNIVRRARDVNTVHRSTPDLDFLTK